MRKLGLVVLVACSGPVGSPAPRPTKAPQPLPSDPIGERPRPSAPTQPAHPIATDTYHGVVVEDRYRWLEDNNNPEVKAWGDALDKKTRAQLDAAPEAAKLKAELTEIMNAPITEY